ncbi:unnamed protein product [Pleuronectes platessa]|uniref:Uncharacterized protein n=1 Tax=Pleuronectes platessa TaxID=8262 RepID=A0A9N7VSR3_PLEPL|nr:unnamed protein product [Pleuronectes platessa]
MSFVVAKAQNKTQFGSGAASSEEQPDVEVDVASTQNTEEETQPISSQTDLTLTPHVKVLEDIIDQLLTLMKRCPASGSTSLSYGLEVFPDDGFRTTTVCSGQAQVNVSV